MKNNIFTFILVGLCCVIFSACQPKGTDFGTFVHYNDGFIRKYIPDTLRKTLVIDADDFTRPIILGLYKENSKTGDYVPVGDEAQLFANGKLCKNNMLEIKPKDKEIHLGIVFTSSAKQGIHKWHFQVLECGDIECVNGIDVDSGVNLTDMVMCAKFDHQWNPVTKVIFWSGVGLVVLLLLWLFISRVFIWPSTRFSTLYIDYVGELGNKRIRMHGAYELVCTNNRKLKDSFFARLFKGKRCFEYNDFWKQDLVLTNGAKNRLKLSGLVNYTLVGECVRKEAFEIINEVGDKVKIETT